MNTDHSGTLDSSIIVPSSSLRVLLWDIDGTLIRSARKTRALLTVEDHSVYGGLGSAVAETLCRFFPTGMQMIGAEDGPPSAEKIAQRARAMAMAMDCA